MDDVTGDFIEFSCITVQQPIGTYYIGSINSDDLVAISYADIRRPEGRDIERYIGTQRDLSEGRVAELRQYVSTVDACFPTSVILAVDAEFAEFDEGRGLLKLVRKENVAKIIDGQHRIAGLQGRQNGAPFQINVTVFIDMDIEDQAMVFATINLKQTKVTKSLAYDLYEYAQSRSPQKTCHNVAKLVNSKEDSPFYKRIKILGKARGIGPELISQATFVDRLLKLMSRDPMADRDAIKRGKSIESVLGRRADGLIFRGHFIEERDAEIAKIVWNYYLAVSRRWPERWDNLDRGNVLPRTTGFAAFMRLLPEIWPEASSAESIPSAGTFESILARSTLESEEFTSDNFKPGSSGEAALLQRLRADILNR